MYISAFVALAILIVIPTSNVFAGGPRLDYPEDATEEGADCWVDGYDAGFGGKYDNDRAKECLENGDDNYNSSWGYACKDAGYMPDECEGFKNNPQDIEDYEALYQENANNCWDEGYEDAKADKPFNEDRDTACDEYTPDYEGGYNSGCIIDMTDNSCELLIKGDEGYCPWHPDIAACVGFLHNATNKRPASITGACVGMGDPRSNIICPQESNPEGYCLNTNDPVFCKTIGDICDAGGFVRPEYPYCKSD